MMFAKLSIALAFCMLALQLSPLNAAAQTATSDHEQMTLYVGDMLEILPVHRLQNASYTWILTQDRTFVEAARTLVFRKRVIVPGRYTLYAEISSADGSRHINRTFTLDILPRTPGQQIPENGPAPEGTLVHTTPLARADGRVILANGSAVATLTPADPALKPIVADIDLGQDADGNGDAASDVDTKDTFFQTDATPLTLWFAEPFDVHRLAVTAVRPEGAVVQMIEVYSFRAADAQGLLTPDAGITVQQNGPKTFAFSVPAPLGTGDAPLLYTWDFGDGKQSLLSAPEHEYADAGTYTVTVRIRSLTDAKEIGSFSTTVAAEAADDEPVIDDEPEPDEEEPAGEGGGSGILKPVLILIGVFIASVLAGLGAVFVFGKLRKQSGKSLSEHLESMEKSIVGTGSETNSAPVPTLQIQPKSPETQPAQQQQQPKPATPPPAIAQREVDAATTNPVQQKPMNVDEKNAPAWLKSGLTQSTPTQSPAPALQQQKPQPVPPPQPQQPRPQPPAQPQPKPQPAAQPQAPHPAPVTPPWLQQTPSAPAPAQPKPQPVPPPAAPVTPPSSPTPAPSPAPAPAPNPAPATPDQQIATIRVDSIDQQNGSQPGTPPPAQ